MQSPALIIAGITLPVRSRLDLQQSYEPLAGASLRRLADGALFGMRRWRRWKTTIQCAGWLPHTLLNVNFDSPYEIHCVQPVSLAAHEQLPASWKIRADCPVSEVIDESCGVIRLVYPILTVRSQPPKFNTGIAPGWELVCEEV